MAKQLNDVLDLEREIDVYRDTLHLLKSELHRIRLEYFEKGLSLSPSALDEVDEELETMTLTIENALF